MIQISTTLRTASLNQPTRKIDRWTGSEVCGAQSCGPCSSAGGGQTVKDMSRLRHVNNREEDGVIKE